MTSGRRSILATSSHCWRGGNGRKHAGSRCLRREIVTTWRRRTVRAAEEEGDQNEATSPHDFGHLVQQRRRENDRAAGGGLTRHTIFGEPQIGTLVGACVQIQRHRKAAVLAPRVHVVAMRPE